MKFIIAISAMLSLATALPIPTSLDIQETGGAPAPAAPSGCIESHNGGAYVSDDDCCATKGNGRCASGFTGGQTSTVCYNGEGWNAYRVKCQKEVPTGSPAPAAPSGCIESHNGGAYVSDDDCCATKGNGRCASGFTGGQTSTVCYNGEGWNAYRVKCQKEVPTAHKCSGTYREITGDEPNWGAVISGGSIANVASSAKCASLCDANQRCLSYEFYPTRNKCNLNKVTIPSVNQQHEDAIYCIKKQDCASGYTFVIGDEPNWGNVMAGGSKKDTSSSGACGSMCDAQDKCLSYEWYPTRQVCNLNIVAQPSDPNQHEDSVYCIKKTTAPTAHPTFTTGSPTRPPTRAPTRVPTGSPTRPPTRTRVLPGWCREWRHQNTGQSQEMHGTATYFTGTSVTQKSCIDRCDESPRCHQAVFEESGPWGPQCWLGNRKSSIIPKGSRNCSNAPASRPRVPCVDFCYNKEGWEAVPAPPVPNCYFQFQDGCGGRCSQKRVWQCGHAARSNPLLAYDTWHRRLQHNGHETTCSTRGSPLLSQAEAAACVLARCPNGGSFRITANGQGMTGPSSSSACGSGEQE